jgi:hypothetical protein
VQYLGHLISDIPSGHFGNRINFTHCGSGDLFICGTIVVVNTNSGIRQRRKGTMSDRIVELETEEVECTCEASDEALELAAGEESAFYTLGACTGLSVCPA